MVRQPCGTFSQCTVTKRLLLGVSASEHNIMRPDILFVRYFAGAGADAASAGSGAAAAPPAALAASAAITNISSESPR